MTKKTVSKHIREEHARLLKSDVNQLLKECKKEDSELKFLHPHTYYKKLIYNPNLDDILDVSGIYLEFVESKEQRDIWNFFRSRVSILTTRNTVGRAIKILIREKNNNKVLGFASLNDDVSLGPRNVHAGIEHTDLVGKDQICKYFMNIGTCIPLQPFGFNFCGGKLIAELMFSREVAEYVYKKYNIILLGLTTTSLYGKSMQYCQVPHLKFVGYTSGRGTYHLPKKFCDKCIEFGEVLGYDKRMTYKSCGKMRMLNLVFNYLGLDNSLLFHDNKKGIYFGWCYPSSKKISDSKEFEKLNTSMFSHLQTVDEIFSWWLGKRATRRYEKLVKDGRVSDDIQFSYESLSTVEKHVVAQEKYQKKVVSEKGEDKVKEEKRKYMKAYRAKNRKDPSKETRGRKSVVTDEIRAFVLSENGTMIEKSKKVFEKFGVKVSASTISRVN